MKTKNYNYSVIIIAGGNSYRMGYPKLWLKDDNGISFLSTICNTYKRCGFADIIVVINEKFTTKEWKNEIALVEGFTTIIINSKPENGRLYSLSLGLKAVKTDSIFIHNVDNPFIEKEVIEQLVKEGNKNGVTIPTYKGKGGHPVIIDTNVKFEITSNYSNYKTLKEVFEHFPKKRVEVNSDSILSNINTPEQLAKTNYELV